MILCDKKVLICTMMPGVNTYMYQYNDLHRIHIFTILLFRGPSLIDYLDQLPSFNRSSDQPVRMPVVDRYKVCWPSRFSRRLPVNLCCKSQHVTNLL